MQFPATTWLLGGTSIYASSIYFYARDNKIPLTPFCSPHAKWPTCEDWDRINFEDQPSVAKLLTRTPPSLLIYGAGYCNVGKCQADPGYAHSRNVESLEHLLNVLCAQTRLVYLSSDHVFGGGQGPYNELSAPHPISAYGRSKLEAEELVRRVRPDALVIRTGLVIGPSISGRHGHLDWLRYRTKNQLPLSIIAGEFRSAVTAEHYAKRIFALAHSNASGVQHIVSNQSLERPTLARNLLVSHDINAFFQTVERQTLSTPHLGNVQLTSLNSSNELSPLPSFAAHGPYDVDSPNREEVMQHQNRECVLVRT